MSQPFRITSAELVLGWAQPRLAVMFTSST